MQFETVCMYSLRIVPTSFWSQEFFLNVYEKTPTQDSSWMLPTMRKFLVRVSYNQFCFAWELHSRVYKQCDILSFLVSYDISHSAWTTNVQYASVYMYTIYIHLFCKFPKSKNYSGRWPWWIVYLRLNERFSRLQEKIAFL